MTLITELEEDLTDAIKSGEESRRDTLRLIRRSSAWPRRSCSARSTRARSCRCFSASARSASRRRRPSATPAANQQADQEEDELEVIEDYMPEPISEDELEQIVDDAIAETGATSLGDLGRVMADVMPQVAWAVPTGRPSARWCARSSPSRGSGQPGGARRRRAAAGAGGHVNVCSTRCSGLCQ